MSLLLVLNFLHVGLISQRPLQQNQKGPKCHFQVSRWTKFPESLKDNVLTWRRKHQSLFSTEEINDHEGVGGSSLRSFFCLFAVAGWVKGIKILLSASLTASKSRRQRRLSRKPSWDVWLFDSNKRILTWEKCALWSSPSSHLDTSDSRSCLRAEHWSLRPEKLGSFSQLLSEYNNI